VGRLEAEAPFRQSRPSRESLPARAAATHINAMNPITSRSTNIAISPHFHAVTGLRGWPDHPDPGFHQVYPNRLAPRTCAAERLPVMAREPDPFVPASFLLQAQDLRARDLAAHLGVLHVRLLLASSAPVLRGNTVTVV
jgi:hypothetical protein